MLATTADSFWYGTSLPEAHQNPSQSSAAGTSDVIERTFKAMEGAIGKSVEKYFAPALAQCPSPPAERKIPVVRTDVGCIVMVFRGKFFERKRNLSEEWFRKDLPGWLSIQREVSGSAGVLADIKQFEVPKNYTGDLPDCCEWADPPVLASSGDVKHAKIPVRRTSTRGDGRVFLLSPGSSCWVPVGTFAQHGLRSRWIRWSGVGSKTGDHIMVPVNYDGNLPEGCAWATCHNCHAPTCDPALNPLPGRCMEWKG